MTAKIGVVGVLSFGLPRNLDLGGCPPVTLRKDVLERKEVDGSMVIGSMGCFTYSTYEYQIGYIGGFANPLIRTFDPNFLGHPSMAIRQCPFVCGG